MTEDNDNIPSPDDSTLDPPEISPAPSPGSMSDPLIGTKIGSCTLKRVIGSGGMGTVYEAVQEQPRRRVALKMMKRGITSRSATRRFEFESQTLARLKHHGVAQIYEAGTHDDGSGGVPYFVMEYIANAKSLTQYAEEKKLGTRERLAIFAKVCDAVQHGHLKGIVHRDLKPGNILVDSSGQPKVIDFGVARSTDSDLAVTTLQTDVGQLVGTLQYMSPEQVEADPNDIDVRSDVYALGVVLYELLTGKPPYDVREAAIHEAVRMVREEEPTKLSTIDRHLRGDIETIALKALNKERERRYQSATALREDIAHYLADEPIAARPPGAVDYLRRFARKYKAATAAIVSIFLVLIIATVAISVSATEARNMTLLRYAEKSRVTATNSVLKSLVRQMTGFRNDEANKKMILYLLRQRVDKLDRHPEVPLVQLELLTIFGNAYMTIEEYDKADALLQEAMEINQGGLLWGTSTIQNMGRLRMRQGRFAEAE
ncbi:MAG TPA: serine/threonine protein kinase, partial [Phycisphaerales bacterium]|nr:serine/threonine protein kinase [Phycisphaerales bacterium]